MNSKRLKILRKALYVVILGIIISPWFFLFIDFLIADIIELIAVLLTLTFFGIQSLNRSIETKEKKEDKESELKKEIQSNFNTLISLFEKLCRAQNLHGISKTLTMTIRSSEKMQKYFGIYPEPVINGVGRDIDDLDIYFLNGSFYLIPKSGTLRFFPLDKREYEQYFTKNDERERKREFLNRFYERIIKFVEEKFSVSLEVRNDMRIF